jgi:hypothetical protein
VDFCLSGWLKTFLKGTKYVKPDSTTKKPSVPFNGDIGF